MNLIEFSERQGNGGLLENVYHTVDMISPKKFLCLGYPTLCVCVWGVSHSPISNQNSLAEYANTPTV